MTPRSMIAAFGTAEGELAVGGIPLQRLTTRVGTTPYFAYDRRLLSARIGELRSALPPALRLKYAVKANPMPAVVHHIASLVDGLDVASAQEMSIALDTPITPEHVSFAGPGKTQTELRQAVAAGVTVELESAGEARRIVEAGEELGLQPRVALRVNPDFRVKGSGMQMGGGPQQFGVDVEQVPGLLADIGAADLDFVGFHVFAGAQNLNPDILCEAQRRTVELLLQVADKVPGRVRYLNIGGGFGIPYFPKDEPLDLAPLGANLAVLIDDVVAPNLPEAEVTLELGRYIVGECGVYVTRVIDRKVSRGRTYLVVDGGLHHQLSASGNFGQVIRRNYPVAVGNRMAEDGSSTVTVVGCLCTPLDVLANDVVLPEVLEGDLIVVFQAGAYGLTASPTAFLGHPHPPEVLV